MAGRLNALQNKSPFETPIGFNLPQISPTNVAVLGRLNQQIANSTPVTTNKGTNPLNTVKDLATSILRAPQRAITSVALEPAAGILSLLTKKNVEPIYQPEGKLAKAFFGSEPIRGVFKQQEEAQKITQNILGKSDLAKGASMAIAPILVGGSIGIDLSPWGGGTKKVSQQVLINLAKNTTKEGAEQILKKAGIKYTDDLIEATIKAKNVGEVEKIFNVPEVSLAQEARQYKSAEEFVKNKINDFRKLTSRIEKAKEAELSIKSAKETLKWKMEHPNEIYSLNDKRILADGKTGIDWYRDYLNKNQIEYKKLTQGKSISDLERLRNNLLENPGKIKDFTSIWNEANRATEIKSGKLSQTAGISDNLIKELKTDDVRIMEDFVDTFGIGNKLSVKQEKNARYLLEGLGLDPNISNTKISNIFKQGLNKWSAIERNVLSQTEPKQIINIERLNIPQQAKQTIQKTIDEIRPELEAIKGGVLKNEDVIEAAKTSDILSRVTSKEATLKSEALLLKTRQQLAELAKQEKITPEFIQTLKIVRAEATKRGRELQALGISADPALGSVKTKIVQKLIDLGKNIDDIVREADGINFNNAQEVTEFYRKFVKPTLPELIDEYRYINLLSSPKTHIVNTFSNLLQVAGLRPANRLASGLIDNIASKLTGKEQEFYIKQVPAYYKGVYNSIGDATKGFVDALRGKTLIYRPDLSRIPTDSKLLKPFQYIPRLLEGSDIFFRTLAMGGEMEALLKAGIKESVAVGKAEKTAAELVFRKALDPTNKTGQGIVLSGIDKLTSAAYKLRSVPGMKWFIPFVQTPMNILKQGIEYSPLGITTLAKNTNKIEQLGKAMVGSTIFTGAGWLALNDKTTWAKPTNEKEKKAYYDAGMQPYSIKVGDKWISYSRLGTLAYPIAMAAAIKYYLKENPKSATDTNLQKISKVFSGIAQFFADQSYLDGIGDFIDVARGDITAISRIASNIPSQLIPLSSLQRWITNLIDPIYRKSASGISVDAIIQNLKKGIPILSTQVPAYETPTGEPSKRQYPIFNQLSPISITKEKQDSKELFDLIQKTSKEKKVLEREQEANKLITEAEYNRLKTIPKEQAAQEFDNLIKNNPDFAQKILSLMKEEERNLSPKEELFLSLGVENGLRAKTIKSELDKLQTKEEKSAYYQELIDKKIITKQVNGQLIKLLQGK
jgi:hypothetical protein